MNKTLEITVPVTVTVKVSGNSVLRWKVDGGAVDFKDYGGFFSDAEEAAGVWIVEENEWDTQGDYWKVAQSAKDWVRTHLGEVT